jgi:hypothetical protein
MNQGVQQNNQSINQSINPRPVIRHSVTWQYERWQTDRRNEDNDEELHSATCYILIYINYFQINVLLTKVKLWRMLSSGMLRRVALARTDVSRELCASIIRVTRIGELGTLDVTSNWHMLRRNTLSSTQRNIPADGILHSHRRENLKSYKQN